MERALEREPEIGWLLAVHHETTTGRLNDLDALGAICRRRGVRLLLDSVSSFGAEAIDWEGWNLEACASTANKCLHGVPGVAFVVAREEAFASRRSGAAGLYLDLFAHRSAQDAGHPLFTPAVHVAFALREALSELAEQGGWRARQRRYRELSGRLRSGLRALGVELLLESEAASASSLTAFQLPPGLDFLTLHDGLARAGFVIYPGQEHLGERIFRLAVMGSLGMADIERFLEAFAQLRGADGSADGRLPIARVARVGFLLCFGAVQHRAQHLRAGVAEPRVRGLQLRALRALLIGHQHHAVHHRREEHAVAHAHQRRRVDQDVIEALACTREQLLHQLGAHQLGRVGWAFAGGQQREGQVRAGAPIRDRGHRRSGSR